MYVSEKEAIKVLFSLRSSQGAMADEEALVDSGVTHNFIDKRMVDRLQIPTMPIGKPHILRNADGTQNKSGTLMSIVKFYLIVGDQQKWQEFYVTNLGKDRLILGFPWLKEFNPHIDWTAATIKEDHVWAAREELK